MLLPPDDKLTYVIETYEQKEKMTFNGAPSFCFNAVILINLDTDSQAHTFLEKMMEHSSCTYRVTRMTKTGMKRVAYKLKMHCQHHKKL